MGAASGQLVSQKNGSADAARLAVASIHPGLTAVIAIDAFEVSEITEGRAPGTDAGLQHIHKAGAQVFQLL